MTNINININKKRSKSWFFFCIFEFHFLIYDIFLTSRFKKLVLTNSKITLRIYQHDHHIYVGEDKTINLIVEELFSIFTCKKNLNTSILDIEFNALPWRCKEMMSTSCNFSLFPVELALPIWNKPVVFLEY